MNKCASPISASEAASRDPFADLWALGCALRRGEPVPLAKVDLRGLTGLEATVGAAVAAHLAAVVALTRGDAATAFSHIAAAEAVWSDVAAELEASSVALTPQSHAFHARLAARNGDFFRSVEARALGQWLMVARLRSRFLLAVANLETGRITEGLRMAQRVSDDWRAALSPRLPGLAVIERRAQVWAEQHGQAEMARLFAGRTESHTGRNAPYAEDGPEVWAMPRRTEAVLRFAAAACPVDWPNGNRSGQTQEI